MEAKIKSLLSKLDFDGCLELFDQLLDEMEALTEGRDG